jgi:hypothetical protein
MCDRNVAIRSLRRQNSSITLVLYKTVAVIPGEEQKYFHFFPMLAGLIS